MLYQKHFLFIIPALILLVFIIPVLLSEDPLVLEDKVEVEDTAIILFAVGDIILDRGVELNIKKNGNGDFRFPFLRIADDLKEADILFGNLEGLISDQGENVGSIYSFRANPEAIEGLKYAGFDVLSLANNHMLDYGRDALEDTFKRLKEAGIDYVGAGLNEQEAYSPLIKEVKETKIAFLAYTDLGPESWKATNEYSGMAWINEEDMERVKKDIEKAKEESDILIISLHSGKEYSTTPSSFQSYFFKACIDAGADMGIGHHPHVVQDVEKYGDGWIAYSLGNFVFDQGFSEETMESCLLRITIKDKKIEQVSCQKVKISDFFQPYFTEKSDI